MNPKARAFALIAVALCAGVVSAENPPAHKPPAKQPPATSKPRPKPFNPMPPPRVSTQPGTQPATQPSTQPTVPMPTTQPVVPGSPRDVMRSVMQVVGRMESPDRLPSLIACDKDDEKKLIAALTQRYLAADAFYKAIGAKFGVIAAATAIESLDDFTVMGERKTVLYAIEAMDRLTEKINGDEATLLIDGKDEWMILRRIDGVWRLPFAQFTKDDSSIEGPLPYETELANAEASNMRALTAEVTQGKHNNEQSAIDAMEKKMKQVTSELEKKYKFSRRGGKPGKSGEE